MTLFLAILVCAAILVVFVPALVLLSQALMACIGANNHSTAVGRRPSVAILVPAHNEEGGIAVTIKALLPQLQDGDRVLVVADNCSDDTAGAARRAGADVCERFDAERRGKGYALDFGVRRLADLPPEVMLIVDADCLVAAGAIDTLARTALHNNRPVQALYLMYAPPSASLMKKIAEFAWVVKNLVRPLGSHRMGLPCQLMGTGMAFPWHMISTASLANGHIVEDMKLGLELARAGTAPMFCPTALVSSTFPTSDAGTRSQRTRWEHGHMSMITSEAPKLLFAGLAKINLGMIGMALDLCVPPVALLCLLSAALFVVAAFFSWFSAIVLPLALATVMLFMIGIAIGLSWWAYGRKILNIVDLISVIPYIFRKVPLYLRFLVNRQVEWVRSKRDSE